MDAFEKKFKEWKHAHFVALENGHSHDEACKIADQAVDLRSAVSGVENTKNPTDQTFALLKAIGEKIYGNKGPIDELTSEEIFQMIPDCPSLEMGNMYMDNLFNDGLVDYGEKILTSGMRATYALVQLTTEGWEEFKKEG